MPEPITIKPLSENGGEVTKVHTKGTSLEYLTRLCVKWIQEMEERRVDPLRVHLHIKREDFSWDTEGLVYWKCEDLTEPGSHWISEGSYEFLKKCISEFNK